MGRRFAARSSSIYFLSARMDIQHASRCGTLAARYPACGTRRRFHPERLFGLQLSMDRLESRAHRCALLEAAGERGNLDRLPAVLLAVSVSVDAAGIQERRISAVA